MRKFSLFIFAMAGILFSCHENVVIETVAEEELDLSPTCTYTVDGVVYECDTMTGWGNGNVPVNPENDTAINDYDTLFHHTMTTLSKSISAKLEINIGKKVAFRDLIHISSNFYKLSHKERENFLVEGSYPYSWDFDRNNTQDGVALKIRATIDGEIVTLNTYSTAYRNYPSAVTAESHRESSFVITRIHHSPNGGIVVEADFEALFFGHEHVRPTELVKKVKGSARFPIIWVD